MLIKHLSSRKAILLISVLLLSACDQSEQQKLVVTGSSTIAPLLNEMAQRYESLHPNTRIDVQTGGSSRGINDARKKLANIGMVSRALKPTEKDLTAHTIALDGITIIVHKDNPIRHLSKQQVIDVFTGKVDNWQQLDGSNHSIVVVNKAEGRSTLELFLAYFDLTNRQIDADIIIGDNQQALKTVIGNPFAIAYVSIGAAAYEADNKAPIHLLPIANIEATLANVKNQSFPLSRPLNLVTLNKQIDNKASLITDFIQFTQSPDVTDLISQQFFIAPLPVAKTANHQTKKQPTLHALSTNTGLNAQQ